MTQLKIETISVKEALDRVKNIYAGRESDFTRDLALAKQQSEMRVNQVLENSGAKTIKPR